MTAKVTIYDNDIPKDTYVLNPVRTCEGSISTKYVFEFEYNELNYNKYNEGNKNED